MNWVLFRSFNIFILLVLIRNSGQLRNVYRKLESDVQSGKRRFQELVEQCDSLKKGREESVSVLKGTFYNQRLN